MDVGNGLLTSFWYDAWSPLGCILDITGRRGVIDMGISLDCTVATVFQTHRRRRHHRVDILNRLEAEIENRARSRRRETEDVSLWRFKGDKFKNGFITKGTYNMLRQGDDRAARVGEGYMVFTQNTKIYFSHLAINEEQAFHW